jgi:hypothetical protein
MHSRLQELVDLLGARRREVLAAVATAPDGAPGDGGWSAAEIVDHLAVVETGVSKLVHVMLSRHPGPLPRETATDSVLHRLDHLGLEARTRRIAAPAAVQPRPGVTRAMALADLERSRARLLETLEGADGVALGTFSFPHPLLGPLDLYQWLLFLAQHERRHTHQIAEIRQ